MVNNNAEKSASNEDDIIGKNIRHYRVQSNLTMRDIAKTLGITYQQVAKYESGTNRISASRLYKISHILNVDITKFFEHDDLEAKTQDNSK